VELQTAIVYEPLISFKDVVKKTNLKRDTLLLNIAVASFFLATPCCLVSLSILD
jgi:hypothetical protein